MVVTMKVIVVVTVSLLQKRPSNVSLVQVHMLWPFWAPLGTSTMAPLWLEQVYFHG